MASPKIKIKHAVAGRVPTTSQIDLGELAINTTDGKLFLKRSLNSVESIIDVGGSLRLLVATTVSFNSTIMAPLVQSQISNGMALMLL